MWRKTHQSWEDHCPDGKPHGFSTSSWFFLSVDPRVNFGFTIVALIPFDLMIDMIFPLNPFNWVNYTNSLTWNKANIGIIPYTIYTKHDSRLLFWEQSRLVISLLSQPRSNPWISSQPSPPKPKNASSKRWGWSPWCQSQRAKHWEKSSTVFGSVDNEP